MLEKQKLFSKKRHVFLLSLFISSILSVTGYLFYKKEEKSFKEQRHKELQITAEMKALQLSEWYKDEIFDVEVFYENNLLRKTIIEWLGTKNETTKQILSNQLELIKKSHGYEEILITDPNGKIHINVGDYIPQLDSTTLSFINKVIDTKKIISTDLYFCGNHKQPHIDFIAPVINSSNEAIAVFLFRIDPVNYLYPLLYSWLSETETGDMYIVRKENDSALLLSNSRNNLKTALKFRYSLYDTKYPAVQAVNGKVGFYEGIDLRDKEVLANLNPILGTNWFLITKIDKDEIYSELYFKTGVLIAFITFMILSSALGLMWVYQIRQKNIYKELFIKERELWQSQEEYRTILYSIGDAVITTDVNGFVKQMNPVAEKLTGWNEENAVGVKVENVFKIINEETRETVTSPVQKVLKEGLVVGLANHTLLIRKDGTELPIADSGAPIKNRENHIIGVILVFRDQTEERAKLKSIQESERKFRLLITKMQQGLALHEVICDQNEKVINYKFLEVNENFEKITGLKSEDIIGKTVLEVLPKTENYWIEKYGHVALTGEPLIYENYSQELERYYEVIAYSPQYKQFAVIINDVTEKKLMLKEIIESKEKVERSEKLKSEFLAQMSHEIRSPINIIINYLELLKTDIYEKLNEEQRTYFSSIDSANKRVIRTIDSILNMSELHLGIYEIVKKEVDLVKLVDSLRKEYLSAALSRNLDLNFNTEFDSAKITVDEYALSQTFANLIDNAIKYTYYGSVNINLRNHIDGSVLVEISDTGIGISEEYLPYIFTPFSQEEGGYSRRFEGNGLGLALVKKYCEINGIEINVTSKKGKGTTFSIKIPLSNI